MVGGEELVREGWEQQQNADRRSKPKDGARDRFGSP